jgi:DNA-binding PadR family transcriptional regulator
MHSQVNWSLLGLVIKRPSYAYELAQRFERTYEGVLALSSVSHIYTAIASLKDRSLIEQIPGTGTQAQGKPIYRATEHGSEEYRRWLLGQVGEDRRRQQLFVLQWAALIGHPEAALGILSDYEQECEAQKTKTRTGEKTNETVEANGGLVARLLAEEQDLSLDAKLAWAQYAQRELEALSRPSSPQPRAGTSSEVISTHRPAHANVPSTTLH